MPRTLLAISLIALTWAGLAISAAKPKPWQWTTAQAATSLTAFREIHARVASGAILSVDVLSARCVGRGKAVLRRYVSFRCAVGLREGFDESSTKIFWLRVRPVGKGEPCWSFASLSAVAVGCLSAKGGVRVRGRDESAGDLALQVSLGGPGGLYQGPISCIPEGLGYFSCWFGGQAAVDDPNVGTATVVLLKSGAQVTVTKTPAG